MAVKTWFDRYFELFRSNYFLASITLSLLIFAIGAFISWQIDFLVQYLTTLPIYLGVIGITWGCFWIGWSRQRLRYLYVEIRPAFWVTDDEFEKQSSLWREKYSNSNLRVHMIISAVIIVLCWIYIAWISKHGGVPYFRQAWSIEPHLWVKNIIIDLYAVPIIIMISGSVIGVGGYTNFISSISRLPAVPFLQLARIKMRPVTDIGLVFGLVWSGGVSLFVIFFRPVFDLGAACVIFLLTLPGLAMFVWPQYALHNCLNNTKQQMLTSWADNLRTKLGLDMQIGSAVFMKRLYKIKGEKLTEMMQSIQEEPTTVYNTADVLYVLTTWILPFISWAAKQLF